jgi:hypothetical protein
MIQFFSDYPVADKPGEVKSATVNPHQPPPQSEMAPVVWSAKIVTNQQQMIGVNQQQIHLRVNLPGRHPSTKLRSGKIISRIWCVYEATASRK